MSELSSNKKTPLEEFHKERGARMIAFAGWSMPVSYADKGIIAEHNQTREAASLFDVSHMCQMKLTGADIETVLDRVLPVTMEKIKPGRNKYSFACTPDGGVLDDLIVGNDGDSHFLVCNASRTEVVVKHLKGHMEGDAQLEMLSDRALLAIQGPQAESLVADVFPDSIDMFFMDSAWMDFDGAACRVSRSGYTGEDGFEISVPSGKAEAFARRFVAEGGCGLAGLGARDTLRIEAGLCLYGQDIDESTTPVEASLTWAIAPSARKNARFLGAERILGEIENGAPRKLVGLAVEGKKPLRKGASLYAGDSLVGEVTSGTYSPTLKRPVALAMIASELAQEGGKFVARRQGAETACEVAALPFVPHRYKIRGKKK